MHSLEDVLLHAIIALVLAGHTVVVGSKIAHLQRVLPHLELLKQLGHLDLVRTTKHLLLEGLVIG